MSYTPFPHTFSGNPLNRSAGDKKDEGLLRRVLLEPGTRAVLHVRGHGGGQVMCRHQVNCELDLYLPYMKDLLALNEFRCAEDLLRGALVVLLGRQADQTWVVAVDAEKIRDGLTEAIKADTHGGRFKYEDGRRCMMQLSRAEAAIAGQAISFCCWHAANVYDASCGELTKPIESGLKRKSDSSFQKLYPRIDPVVICLVISPCGQFALLGNMKRSPKNFFSCISGFVEPCESVQEAAVREIREETGISVCDVAVVDSQPWPIGRGGRCELMIGCTAHATSMEINIDDPDVETVRWFHLREIKNMLVEATKRGSTVARNGFDVPAVPGPYAIAHHLLRHGVDSAHNHTSGPFQNALKAMLKVTIGCGVAVGAAYVIANHAGDISRGIKSIKGLIKFE